MNPVCEHYELDPPVDPPLDRCSACVEIGAGWEHLRQCLTCGLTRCCDKSPNRHASAHFRGTGHPMIRSAQPDEDWRWCYVDDRIYTPGPAGYESTEQ
jgi:CPA1 family monovalent cation:H+ antiporter